ncbi:hypothetical protein PG991_015845 [Apiospora marii]|uniref:Uncharacterized protein n=1 Tax=Apiospora marii TaxID=335849 RepID=A0ABR1R1P0_9PEZI
MALQHDLDPANAEVEQLTRENEQLRLRLKLAEFTQRSIERPVSTSSQPTFTTSSSTPNKRCSSTGQTRVNSPEKSYLRPTAAWMNRTRSPEPQAKETCPARAHTPACEYRRSFMQPTISSLNKVQRWYGDEYDQGDYDNEDDSEPDEWKHHWDSCPDSDVPGSGTSSTCVDDQEQESWVRTPTSDLPVAEEPPTLAERTRLYDSAFENEASIHVEIESVVAFRLLTEAFDLVRSAFYDFCKEHQPGIWRHHFPGGPHEVLLEYPEIVRYLGYWHNDKVPDVHYVCVRSSLLRVKDLRNALCHFTPYRGVEAYDELIRDAQAAVVDMNDEPRAFKLRALRDELRAIAGETLKEIEELGMVSIAPCHREWKPHHEGFFRTLLDGRPTCIRDDPAYQHSPAVLLAFEAWRWQRQRLFMDHPLLEGEDISKGLFD